MNKITYRKEGDYLVPDLYLPKQPSKCIGKYGMLRLNYLKEYKKGLYTELIINGKLYDHLAYIDEDATKRVSDIINKLVEAEGIDENLKQANQMKWVQTMNNIKNRAEEIIYDEISEKILKNAPKQNKKYVKKQLEKLDENILDYLCYWNEKFYRNGFVDGVQMIMGSVEK